MVHARLASTLILISAAAIGCSSDSNSNSSNGLDSGITTHDGTGDGQADGNDEANGEGNGDGNSDSNSDSNGGDGDSKGGDGDGDDSSSGSNTKWDLGTIPDGGLANCGGMGGNEGEPEFSFLWAANSSQGTISKIDTTTVQEVGRFRVRPDGAGSPSRTSVSLSGHVAVASRSGGVTKFYATADFC